MMEDYIGGIIWAAVAIGISVLSALKNKKGQKGEAVQTPKPKSNPFADLEAAERARKSQPSATKPRKKARTRNPEVVVTFNQQAAQLPEEAQRVTTSAPRPMPQAQPRKNPLGINLKDREQLKRAIVLGEILPPKF